jgi:regulation of enolase protein 1 (concanavalin A-like superfamily)
VVVDAQNITDTAVVLIDDFLFRPSPGEPSRPLSIFESTQMPFDTNRPTLSWDDNAWPTTYRLQVTDNTQLNQPILDAVTQWPWYDVPADLNWNVPYHWRLQAQNGSGESLWLYCGQFIAQSGSAYLSDEFKTKTLSSAWSWVREDPTHWGWDGPAYTGYQGELKISLQPGSLDGPTNDAKNVLLRQNPGNHVAFSTRLRFAWGTPQSNTEQAGLIVYQDDDNFIKLVRGYQDGYVVGLGLERNGQTTWYATTVRETTVYLRIERNGTIYQGYFSVDGFIWYPVGPGISVSWSSPQVGLIAYAGQSTSQYDALFDWWRLVDLDVLPLCYDFNGNGQTDGAEIRDLTTRWRQAAMPPYDTNGDGEITILDIMRAATRWGNNCATTVIPIATPTITPTPPAPQNRVQNPSFEEGVYAPNNPPSFWSTDAWRGGSTFIWDNAQAHTGTKSVRIDSPLANDVRWIQTVQVTPNTNYTLSGWIKTVNVVHAEGQVVAGANLGLFGTWDHTADLFETKDWTFVSMQFNSGSNTQVTVACRLGYWSGTATGTIWCDDITLTQTNMASSN